MTVRIIVAVFNNSNSAYEAASAIHSLKKSDQVDFSLKAGAMFSKDQKGNVIRLEEKDCPLWGTLAGGVAGGVVGPLVGGSARGGGGGAGPSGGPCRRRCRRCAGCDRGLGR